MPLTKSIGNMYSWVTHMHSHLGGKCPHQCLYCYVGKSRYGVIPRYEGEIRLIEKELKVNYGEGKTIFVEHMNDMFADSVPFDCIAQILDHCNKYPRNTYVFQSKNTARMASLIHIFPPKSVVGTTIETNRELDNISKAPKPQFRTIGMLNSNYYSTNILQKFVTIEPIIAFDLDVMLMWLTTIKPDFINIGADSKKCGLPEPTAKEVNDLIQGIKDAGLTIRVKNNLQRLLDK